VRKSKDHDVWITSRGRIQEFSEPDSLRSDTIRARNLESVKNQLRVGTRQWSAARNSASARARGKSRPSLPRNYVLEREQEAARERARASSSKQEREREREMRNRDVRNGRVGEEGSAVRKRVLSRIGFRISGKIKAGTGSPRNGQAILYS